MNEQTLDRGAELPKLAAHPTSRGGLPFCYVTGIALF
jgi:hypothetical protein